MADDNSTLNPIELATELTIAWLGNPNTRASSDEVPAFLGKMHDAVVALGQSAEIESSNDPAAEFTPATSVRRSLASKDHIISLIDGKPYKTLRRHLGTHGLTPEEYRARYKLKPDYPMVAPNYSEARRSMAHKIGLGSKPRIRKASSMPATPGDSPTPKSRSPKTSGKAAKPTGRRGRPPKNAPEASNES